VRLIAVPPDRAGEFLPIAAGYIISAVERVGISDAGAVLAAVSAGRALLWLAVDDDARVCGAGVTELDGDACVIVAWGSDDQERCAPLLATIEQFARDEGCKAVRIYGRAGWQRRLTEYRLKAIIMERPL
jgi:GNAT superfamily N-acetyltransferase